MLGQLSLPGSATHAQVFQCSPETGKFMPFEMGHRHQGIRLHDLFSNINFLEILQVYGYGGFRFTPQTVRDHQGSIHH